MNQIKTASESSSANYSLAKLMDAPGGFEKIALEKLPPFIREMRDYESFGRQVLLVHTITSEEVQLIDNEPYFYYSKDFDSHAAFYADDAETPRLQIEGDGVNVGIVTIMSDDITINLKRLMVQKYNYLERVREKSGQAISKAEDIRIINLVESLLKGNGGDGSSTGTAPECADRIVTSTDTTLSKAHLISLKKKLSDSDIPLAAFVMSRSRQDDVLGWGQAEIDQLTQREMLESGVKYTIWGTVKLVPSRIINSDTVYAFADPEYVGRMPILKDLTVRLTETANKLEKGLFMFEFIGMYLASHKAIAKLVLNFGTSTGQNNWKIKFINDAQGNNADDGADAKDFGGRN